MTIMSKFNNQNVKLGLTILLENREEVLIDNVRYYSKKR